MTNFFDFEMENMGGISSFLFTPVDNITSIADALNNVISEAVVFSGSNDWYTAMALQNSVSFTQDIEVSDAGIAYKTKIAGYVPKLTKEYLALFNEMRRSLFVVKITDNNGNTRLCGEIYNGLQFSFSQASSKSPAGSNGYEFVFEGTTAEPSPFYTYPEPLS
jgi:hypothetical protein